MFLCISIIDRNMLNNISLSEGKIGALKRTKYIKVRNFTIKRCALGSWQWKTAKINFLLTLFSFPKILRQNKPKKMCLVIINSIFFTLLNGELKEGAIFLFPVISLLTFNRNQKINLGFLVTFLDFRMIKSRNLK